MAQATFIHPTAIVEPGGELGTGVRIGPFCHVGPEVVLGDYVELASHVSVMGATTIGAGTRVLQQATLGGLPQSVRHKGGRTTLVIGRSCTIHESVTMHVGTDTSRGQTIVGDNGEFRACSHVAHDCIVGNNVSFANYATLAGHCDIGDFVTISELVAIHQFARIGEGAFLAAYSGIGGDVIPFGLADGIPAKLRGLSDVGMRRCGLTGSEIAILRRVYHAIFESSVPQPKALAAAAVEYAGLPAAMKIIDFMTSRDKRYLVGPPRRPGGGDDAQENA